MDINLIKENVKVEQNIEITSSQILLEGDVIVPDVNPDIAEILENDANIVIDKIVVSENRINYIGKLEIQILYLSKGENTSIHSMNSVIPIDDYINQDGITENMWAEVVPTISNIDYNILNDRKISTRSIINISACAQKQETVALVVDTQELLSKQVKKSTISVNKIVDKTNDRFIVKDQLYITKNSSNIKSILRKDARIVNRDFRCSNGKVYVSAEVYVSILYKGDTVDSIIEIVEKEISLSGYIDVSDARDDMFAYVDLNISEFLCTVKPDDDGEDRVIDVEISILANSKVTKEEEISVIDDGYIIGKELMPERKQITYPRLVCRNKNQSTIKEIVRVTGEDVMQVFKVSANSIVEDVVITDDRLVLEGIINANVIYIAQSDEKPLCSYKTVIPFRQVIEVRGAKSYMNKKINSVVDHVGFSMISDKEIELRVLMSFNAEIIEMKTKQIITDIAVIDKPKEVIEKMPSMTIYAVQKGDKLWDIAKKYNTDIDDIVEVNNIENQDLIFEGQKLLILKKVII